MEKKKRLIDANAIKLNGFIIPDLDEAVIFVKDIINAPTVDAVEVVRCKDCKHYKPRNQSVHWEQKALCCARSAQLKFPADGFCSYGERKDHGTEKE